MFCLKSGNVTVVSHNLPYATALNTSIGSAEIATTGAGCLDTGQYVYQKGTGFDSSLGNGQSFENWGDSGMADNSLQTDTSTDVNTDDKNQLRGVPHGAVMVVNSMDQSKGRTSDQKTQTLRRLAQNREAARRGRLRKKVMSLLVMLYCFLTLMIGILKIFFFFFFWNLVFPSLTFSLSFSFALEFPYCRK
ncbi:hypothetical protein POPTR_010G128001v4 [Populus trichocarpa]|uniref:Uncharacterized protein n=1 Tax=Populus trichocarpa TaxID=3694 RepID=A0ACC0SD52_POPTR|nr:hypothetical protein POPTR_010G128001v4 [Populus trichocarpa]